MCDGVEKYTPVENNYSGNDVLISSVYNLPEGKLILPEITTSDLEKAVKRSKPSVSKNDLK